MTNTYTAHRTVPCYYCPVMEVSAWIFNRVNLSSLLDQTGTSLSSLTEEEQTKQVLELSEELSRRVGCVDASTLPAG